MLHLCALVPVLAATFCRSAVRVRRAGDTVPSACWPDTRATRVLACAGAEVLRKLPMLAHVDLRLSGSEGAGDATRAAVQSLALCSRLVRGLPDDMRSVLQKSWRALHG